MTRFFYTGATAFHYLCQAIEGAKHQIDIQMFIWREDAIGIKLAKLVLEAADRGVTVNLSKDLVGGIFEFAEEERRSFFHQRLPLHFRLMSWILDWMYPMAHKPRLKAQVVSPLKVAIENHPNIHLNCKTAQNNHSKYYIIDNEILIISGMNIEFKEWKHDLLKRPYRDYMIAFESRDAVTGFIEQQAQGGMVHRDLGADASPELDFIMNIVHSSGPVFNAQAAICDRIASAKQELFIAMAYIGDPIISRAILGAVDRGVEVILFLPSAANLQNDLNKLNARRLMRASGNRIRLFFCNHMIHGKLFMVDQKYVNFGSTNFNKQAMSRLQECNVGFFIGPHGLEADIRRARLLLYENSSQVQCAKEIKYRPLRAFLEALSS